MTNTPKPEALAERLPLIAMCLDSVKRADQGDVIRHAAATITTLAAERDALREALQMIANHHGCPAVLAQDTLERTHNA